jgi:outer membrane lipoprotein SlyB
MSTVTQEPIATAPAQGGSMRTVWMVVGGLAIAAAGVGAGLAWRPAATESSSALDASKTVPPSSHLAGEVPPAKPVSKAHRAHNSEPSQAATPLATEPAAVCGHCGVIEGVREVKVKGQGSGIGAVAGGVLGAAVGNQMGGGNGRKAMTVLGAVGGGLAGHEIEKQVRSETVYEVRVRMDDGNVRTFTRKTAPAPGTRVTVEGNTFHTSRAPSTDPQMMRTSGGA